MAWDAINWETVLWIGGFVLLFWFMMRGCGGIMRGGGCGMGGRPKDGDESQSEKPPPHRRESSLD